MVERNEVRQLIFDILKENEDARNDTRKLEWLVKCMTIPLYSLNVTFEDFCLSPCGETIQRIRRDIQNDPLNPMFQATDKEQVRRQEVEDKMRQTEWVEN